MDDRMHAVLEAVPSGGGTSVEISRLLGLTGEGAEGEALARLHKLEAGERLHATWRIGPEGRWRRYYSFRPRWRSR